MDLLTRLVALSHWRLVVRPKAMHGMIEFLRIHLKERGVVQQSGLPDEVLRVLVEEAYRTAADGEKDQMARYGRLYLEIESIAREIDRSFEGKADADPRVKSILAFNHFI